MPSWFSKVFKTDEESHPAPEPPEAALDEEDDDEEEDAPYVPRRVVSAPVVMPEGDITGYTDHIAIKARLEPRSNSCVLMVDRPLLKGHSFWAPEPEAAYASSPLAASLFDLGGVGSVLIHDMTVTITRDGSDFSPWEDFSRRVGDQLRAHLKSGLPVLDPSYEEAIPSEGETASPAQNESR